MTRREELLQAAITAMAALISDSSEAPGPAEVALISVQYAQALLEEIDNAQEKQDD
jgi:hypothetical protein